MTYDFHGKVAIVTGGNGGLGLGLALGLAGAGADILVAARDAGKTAQALPRIQALGVRARGLSVVLKASTLTRLRSFRRSVRVLLTSKPRGGWTSTVTTNCLPSFLARPVGSAGGRGVTCGLLRVALVLLRGSLSSCFGLC